MSAYSEPDGLAVIHVLRAPVGGLFRHVRDLAAAQAASGMRVGVICDRTSIDGLTQERLAAMAPMLALGLERIAMARDVGPADVTAWQGVRRIAREKNVRILHGHGAKGGAYARLAAAALRRAGRDVMGFYTPHGGSLHYDPATLTGRVFMGLERLLAPLSTGIVFESEFARRTFDDRVGRTATSVRVIPNGLAPEEFDPLPPGERPFEFVFVGELRRLKGVDVLLDALARVIRHKPARLLVAGDGAERGSFEDQAAQLGLQEQVQFAGAMPARQAFAQGRVLILPSRAESLPYVVLEAAAAGLPIIATSVGGVPEIVAGSDVELVPPGDADALHLAMLASLGNRVEVNAQALRLREIVSQRYTIEAMSGSIATFYADAIAAKRPG